MAAMFVVTALPVLLQARCYPYLLETASLVFQARNKGYCLQGSAFDLEKGYYKEMI